MKLIGRILLIIAGVALIVIAVPQIINAVNTLNANGWGSIFGNSASLTQLFVLIGSGINVLFGIRALFAAVRGRKSLGLAFTAILLMIPPVATVVFAAMNGTALTWDYYLSVIPGFAIPIVYFLGFLLI